MIQAYGWTDELATAFAPHARAGHAPGRIVVQQRDAYLVVTEGGELRAKASGRLVQAAEDAGLPAVGDWVALSSNPSEGVATIHAVLPRRTAFVRRAAHSERGLQVIGANVDVAFVVTSLNAEFNARRIERYLAAAWQSGARPVVVLTKSDLCADADATAAQIAAVAGDCPVLRISARQGVGLDALLAHVRPRETCVLVGSSGVGKSTLLNALLGEERMATGSLSEDGRQGRHTTSHRELVLLPGGGLILDTPGLREVGLVDADEGVSAVFDDIEQLAASCRFSDCTHTDTPGCAVSAALESGELDADRWAHFNKLKDELSAAAETAVRTTKAAERRRLAASQKAYRTAKKNMRGAD